MTVNPATSKIEITYVSPVLFLLKPIPSCIMWQLKLIIYTQICNKTQTKSQTGGQSLSLI